MNESPEARGKRRWTLTAWRYAPWIALLMWGPYIAVRFLDPHLADGDCSCTESFDRLLPVAPGFFFAVLLSRFGAGENPEWIIAGIISLALWIALSRIAAIGRGVAWFTTLVVGGLSILGAVGLASALAA